MLTKIERTLKFDNRRNFKIITPCCGKPNIDGKFVNYKGFPLIYGYCHSCGKSTTPPTLYKDNKGQEYQWNEITNSWDTDVVISPTQSFSENFSSTSNNPDQQFIPESLIWKYYEVAPENNLLQYLRKSYSHEDVNRVKEDYALGSTKDGGTVFWLINEGLQVQKNKICYYQEDGKRTNRFKAPYKNNDGYYSCLFGAHLLKPIKKGTDLVILVESEKTAVVGAIFLPKFTWLAFGGLNGLTAAKSACLIGHKVLLVPDISEKAVSVAYDKVTYLSSIGVNAKIWDMTEGKGDDELEALNLYNMDLEDFFRVII
ncbi:hypothetical protein FHG64_02605 [Antarcticibacterium flavum]|uniref:DUF6371 domain-containing protein n=1 Tax=Antarcticibacterium flavum TaxID=2058175 RepID=A0A5B7WZ79_9FLAO|nr:MULTISPECIES: DUF6371 domain-containing protein [Antarcticibacterium]QCY68370.1 hypothetical protein FHG64_02605 [Antarcticibacterium flavum]